MRFLARALVALLCLTTVAYAQLFGATPTIATALTLPIAGAVQAQSVVKITGWAGNCAQVTRGDGTTLDIGFVNNICDKVTADTFAARTPLTISKWYDEAGTSDFANATQATQPDFTNLNEVNGIRPVSLSGITTGAAKFLQTTTSINRASFTVYMVVAPRVAQAGNSYLELSDAGFTTSYLNLNTSTGPFASNAGGLVKTTTIFPRSHLGIIAYSSGPSSQIFNINGIEQTFLQASSQQAALLTIGKLIVSTGFNSLNDVYAFILYPTNHTSAQMAQTIAALATSFKPQTTFTNRMIYAGDSLVVSWFASLNQTAPWQGGFGRGISGWETFNMAVGGQAVATEFANISKLTGLFDPTKTLNRVMISSASNDIAAQVSFADQASAFAWADGLYTNTILPMVAQLKAAGFNRVGVPTTIGRGAFTNVNFLEDARVRINSNIVAGAVANGYVVSDRAANQFLSSQPATQNANCYNPGDHTHLLSTGLNCYGIMEAIDKAALLN